MFQCICEKGEIPYDDKMLNWSIGFGENTTFTTEAKKLINQHPGMIKSVDQVQESMTFDYKPLRSEQLQLSSNEVETITETLLPSSREVCRLAERLYP